MKQEILRMERVTYMEDEVILLEDFNLQIYRGEIMGMVYINSHGMTAFLKLLETNLPLYDGYVFFGEEKVNSWKETRKTHNRISVIEAKSRLVENLTVSDNIFVLRHGFGQEVVRTKLLEKQLEPFLRDIDMDKDIPVNGRVADLSVFQRVVVELLRAVVLGNRLIVLNEIGTLISYEELEKLHKILRHYAEQGFSFLYICAHFEEIARICDRAAMQSNGRILKVIRGEDIKTEALRLYPAEYDSMVRGRLESHRQEISRGEELLKINGVIGEHTKNLSLKVYKGECLAIQVLENEAFQEIKEMLLGNLEPEEGEIRLKGKKISLSKDRRIAVVQELATKTMIFPELDYMENLCISLSSRMPEIWLKQGIRKSIRREYGPVLGEEVFYRPVENLSEKQKYQMIYTRILLQKPEVVFCIQPFMGADLSHRMFVWKMLEMLLNQGIAVAVLSLNLSDALSLADRLLVTDGRGATKEIFRKDFASVPEVVPWMHIYQQKEE